MRGIRGGRLRRRSVALCLATLALWLLLLYDAALLPSLSPRVTVLMYHDVVPDGSPTNGMQVTASRFEADMRWLQDNGYTTVLPRELASGEPLPDKAVMVTLDDGYAGNYTYAFPVLQKLNMKAAIAVVVSLVDQNGMLSWDMCREMSRSGLVEIGTQAKKLGFQEVQFDYLRFCTETSMKDVVFDEADTKGRSRTEVICEFMEYAYRKLKAQGLFVSADVYGSIINSNVNANAVGQIYGELAKHVDYISPMIYPSHYGDGYYGIDYPDMHPYKVITAALQDSRRELHFAREGQEHIATVRPWLQDFTASWLKHYIPYGPEQVREQIQATYDAGYDEWLLWDASCRYDWGGLLTPEDAKAEADWIAQSRAALPEVEITPDTAAAASTETAVPSEGARVPETEGGPVPTGSAGPTVGAYIGD